MGRFKTFASGGSASPSSSSSSSSSIQLKSALSSSSTNRLTRRGYASSSSDDSSSQGSHSHPSHHHQHHHDQPVNWGKALATFSRGKTEEEIDAEWQIMKERLIANFNRTSITLREERLARLANSTWSAQSQQDGEAEAPTSEEAQTQSTRAREPPTNSTSGAQSDLPKPLRLRNSGHNRRRLAQSAQASLQY